MESQNAPVTIVATSPLPEEKRKVQARNKMCFWGVGMSSKSKFLIALEHTSRDIRKERYDDFVYYLRTWFQVIDDDPTAKSLVDQLRGKINFYDWYEAQLDSISDDDQKIQINWPNDRDLKTALLITLMERFSDPNERFISTGRFNSLFYDDSSNANDQAGFIKNYLFQEAANELRLYLRNHWPSDYQNEQLDDPVVTDIPAADRLVPLDHNQPSYQEAAASLANVKQEIERINDYDDTNDKEQRLAELSAAQELLRATRLRLKAFLNLIIPTLSWISEKFAASAIGKLAQVAMEKLLALLTS